MQRRGSIAITLAVALTVSVYAVAGENFECDYNSCTECISAPSCIWCSNSNITSVEADTGGTLLQCISKESSNVNKFSESCRDAITDPVTVKENKEDEEFSPHNAVQLRPQRVSLQMRAGASARIALKYRQLPNHPMDVYCLMDGSRSMTELKRNLSIVTNELVEGLEEISNNVQLGFGIFVDKPVLPYTDMNLWSSENCVNCVKTFSFKNVLPLTTDRQSFQDKVGSTHGSTNVDTPEGTLEALMQVASCQNQVGWRKESLKVVVVFTDAGFHIAGDGKLAGIVKPNDKQCHLDDEGEYTHSLWQDYPSVSEVNSVLENSDMYTTFAVPEKQVPLFNMLTHQLRHSSCSDINKYSDIVDLITKSVQNASGTVTLTLKNNLPEVAVDISSSCKGGQEQNTNTCSDMLPYDETDFFINIKIKNCPEEQQQNTTLNFTLNFHSQNFLLDLKMLCQCQCDMEGDQGIIYNADYCKKQGDLRCGACVCNEGFMGKECQCKKGEEGSQDIDEENCIQPNISNAKACSGQGKCVCGQCQCNTRQDPIEVITGHYCQCTNFHKDCRSTSGDICSGHGKCKCNNCECSDGWEGKVCDCDSSNNNCWDESGQICTGNGKCVCNRCECNKDFEGEYCETYTTTETKCAELKACVQCVVFQTGMYAGAACEKSCSSYNITTIPDVQEEYGHLCSSFDEDNCRFIYQFKEIGTTISVWVQEKTECPIEINPWTVVGGVLAAVVLVGLLLLIVWKIVTHIKDTKEFHSFLKNREMAVWSENVSPLYKPATTEVVNPIFESTSAERR